MPDTITTPASTYTPPAGSIVLPSAAYFGSQRGVQQPVRLVQYDDKLPIIEVALYLNGQPFALPAGAAINIRMTKGDGTGIYNPALGVSEDRRNAYIAVTQQMTVVPGFYKPVIEYLLDGGVAGTSPLPLDIAQNPLQEGTIESTDEMKTVQQLVSAAKQAADTATTAAGQASVSASAASNSAAAAAQSEQAAADSEEAAASSAGQAASSASAASGSASSAAQSKQAAAESETAAAASAAEARQYANQAAGDRELSFWVDDADGGLNCTIQDKSAAAAAAAQEGA